MTKQAQMSSLWFVPLMAMVALILGATPALASEVTGTLSSDTTSASKSTSKVDGTVSSDTESNGDIVGTVSSPDESEPDGELTGTVTSESDESGSEGGSSSATRTNDGRGGGGSISDAPTGTVLSAQSTAPSTPGFPNAGVAPEADQTRTTIWSTVATFFMSLVLP